MSGYKAGYPNPYTARLQDHLEPGQTVTVKGICHEEPGERAIDVSLKDESGQVPLTISTRFDEGKIVLNTFKGGEWGKEERKSNPFKKGEPFDLRIRAHQSEFEIDTLGKNFQKYEYQMPLHSISSLEVAGPLTISSVSWGGKYYTVPYEANIRGGLGPGRVVTVTGTPHKKAQEFTVALTHESGDIACRVLASFKDKKVMRNSYQDGKWQNEEKETIKENAKFPFEKEVQFDLVIANSPYKFEVFINGEMYATFAHRMTPEGVVGLKIEGDIDVSGISASSP